MENDGENVLIIDDLTDTGKTAAIVRAMMPKAHFATVYAKPKGRPLVDTFVDRSLPGHLDLFSRGIWASPIRSRSPTTTPADRHSNSLLVVCTAFCLH